MKLNKSFYSLSLLEKMKVWKEVEPDCRLRISVHYHSDNFGYTLRENESPVDYRLVIYTLHNIRKRNTVTDEWTECVDYEIAGKRYDDNSEMIDWNLCASDNRQRTYRKKNLKNAIKKSGMKVIAIERAIYDKNKHCHGYKYYKSIMDDRIGV